MSFQRINHGEELPKFLPISKELGWNKWRHYKNDRKNPKNLFIYTCKKFLGKSVDWAYSYYCSQPKRYDCWDFWDYLKPFEWSVYRRSSFYNGYYVKDGIICFREGYSKKFEKTFTSPDLLYIKGYSVTYKSEKPYSVQRSEQQLNWLSRIAYGERTQLIGTIINGYEITFAERSKEFYRTRAENTQAWRKWRKESKKTKYQGYELTDGKGNKRAIKRQIRKERQLELRKLEKAKNEEIMVRLGFDPLTSFRK